MGAGVADRLALGHRRPWEREVVTPAEPPPEPEQLLGLIVRIHKAGTAGGHHA